MNDILSPRYDTGDVVQAEIRADYTSSDGATYFVIGKIINYTRHLTVIKTADGDTHVALPGRCKSVTDPFLLDLFK